jgi:hypothetical protein
VCVCVCVFDCVTVSTLIQLMLNVTSKVKWRRDGMVWYELRWDEKRWLGMGGEGMRREGRGVQIVR